MPNYTVKQKVQTFEDETRTSEQSVFIDTDDNWMVITHDGYEMPLRPENWEKLKELVEKCQTLIPKAS